MSDLTLKSLYDLTGRIALVTGGGTGIGLMIAQGLAANGAKVYITGRRKEVLQQVADAWEKSGTVDGKGRIIALQMDVTNKESIQAGRKEIEEKEGILHILVNNAGQVGPRTPSLNDPSPTAPKDAETLGTALFAESLEGWRDLYTINTFSIFFVTTAFLSLLDKGSKERGEFTSSVINITSMSGLIKLAQNHFCYNSAKAATSHLTKMLATEFALKGVAVRVNAIAPGTYESEMTEAEIAPQDVNKIGHPLMPLPSKRAGTAQEMAGTVVYPASPAGHYTNGQEIVVDGGYVSVNPSTV